MIRVCVVCEGLTEANFVSQCLQPYLVTSSVCAYASIIKAPSGKHKGGRVTVERLVRHMSHEYRNFDRLTTLVDFYGFQDRAGRNRVQLEAAIREGVANSTTGYDPRFVLPYVQMHEFEGLLFTNPDAFEWAVDGWSPAVRRQLSVLSQTFTNPEDINDGPETAPSKRILSIFPHATYSKPEHGSLIAQAIGIDAIRAKCPAFNEWVEKLEAWGKAKS